MLPFEIPHKISDSYTERDDVYSVLKIKVLADLRARNRFRTPLPDVCGQSSPTL